MFHEEKTLNFLNYLFSGWQTVSSKDFVSGIKYLINSLDGKSKKEIVIYIISALFDEIIVKNLPIYLFPFNKIIRIFIFKIVIDQGIDFIVNKYKQGDWKLKRKDFYERM